MKKLIVLSLLVLTATFAFAQKGAMDPTEKIQKKVDRITEQLNLSADQQDQVKALYTAQHEDRVANKKNKSEMTEEEKAAYKAERKAANKDYKTKLNNILTPEQQQLYKEGRRNKKAAKGKHKNGKHKKGKRSSDGKGKSAEQKAERKVTKLTEQLNLSDAQQQQMMELVLERNVAKKAAGQARKEATSKEAHEALKAERKAENANYKSKFEAILTAEQLAIYKKNEAERKSKRKMK